MTSQVYVSTLKFPKIMHLKFLQNFERFEIFKIQYFKGSALQKLKIRFIGREIDTMQVIII